MVARGGGGGLHGAARAGPPQHSADQGQPGGPADADGGAGGGAAVVRGGGGGADGAARAGPPRHSHVGKT